MVYTVAMMTRSNYVVVLLWRCVGQLHLKGIVRKWWSKNITYPQGKKGFCVIFFPRVDIFSTLLTFLQKSVSTLRSWIHWLVAWLALLSWLSELLTHLCLQALYQQTSQPAGRLTGQLCWQIDIWSVLQLAGVQTIPVFRLSTANSKQLRD